jgi:aspartyl-tRNA(Asn)/glutamyl-tRNA(Gln) amidotransferase subunit C
MIGIKEVEHIAKLARLALSDEEKSLYARQLAKVIEYFDQLKSVDTEGVEPMAAAVPITNVLREDEVKPSPGCEIMLSNAPEREGNLFKVPKITEY